MALVSGAVAASIANLQLNVGVAVNNTVMSSGAI
jgi:hypothetical protein